MYHLDFRKERKAYRHGLLHMFLAALLVFGFLAFRAVFLPPDKTMTVEQYQSYLAKCIQHYEE